MDRQTLLEQKRQRLQELKSRRINSQTSVAPEKNASEIDDLVERMQVIPKTMVSVGVQTDPHESVPNNEETERYSQPPKMGKITFDKGVQAVPIATDHFAEQQNIDSAKENEIQSGSKNEQNLTDDSLSEEIDFENLNSEVSKSLKTLNKLLVQESQEPNYFSVNENQPTDLGYTISNSISALIHSNTIPGIGGRAVKCMDVCQSHPELIVVSYAARNEYHTINDSNRGRDDGNGASLDRMKNSPGCAGVYNIGGKSPVLEFYLLATSSISSIKFDRGQPNKVIGGLSNGRVVIWELQNNGHSIVLLPSLVSPILSTSSNSLIRKGKGSDSIFFQNHTNPVSSIVQDSDLGTHDNNRPAITASVDGIINLWSTSILAAPKVDSLQLYKPLTVDEEQLTSGGNFTSSGPKEKLLITSMILLNHLQQQHSNSSSAAASSSANTTSSNEISEQHAFLNKTIVGCQDGNLYKLCNNKKSKQFIQSSSMLSESEHSMVTTLTELHINNGSNNNAHNQFTIIITTGIENGFKVWQVTDDSIRKVAFVHTNYTLVNALSRPQKGFQFISLGLQPSASSSTHVSPVIEIWNLQKKLMNSILTLDIPEIARESVPTTMEFSDSGDSLYVGFNDGNVLVWNVDDLLLEDTAELNPKIDDGIEKLLSK
ncbi:hypothetical protein CLIB1423_09S05468 [[Candida] railenensis]|uniref:Dynein intermediate chain n=1 Tax=[Candida] railenensis TaxID=45579 RepID=A0A9P0QQR2_9ASCO|nr:hypothetical protein CLIB1423_09S05468 [[Candida] railenensis]